MNVDTIQYAYSSAAPLCTHEYLASPIIQVCRQLAAKRILDLGCGNGAFCGTLASTGFEVVGCDPSDDGIRLARQTHPDIPFHVAGAYDDPRQLGQEPFDVVVSTEVIEHLYQPRALPQLAAQLLQSGRHLILSTPYHGYLKNLALALSGKMDRHFTATWDGGHIKFWSRATLTQLLSEEGFLVRKFIGAGRVPYLWKSMILVAEKA